MATEIKPSVFDLSTVHSALENVLYDTPKTKEEWDRCRLEKELIDEFWANGFISHVPILTVEQCDLILEEYKYFMDDSNRHPGHEMLYEYRSNQSGDPNNVIVHVLGHWRLTPLFHDLVFHPAVVVPCSQLLVEEKEVSVRFWHDQLFAKPAQRGGNVAWHQDYSYWTRTTPMSHVTIHIALDDQTLENGTVQYIPGSHRWTRNGNPLPVTDFNFVDMESIKTILTAEELSNFKPEPTLLKKGEASFHHPLAVHGSFPNRSDKPRRAAVLNYFTDGVVSNTSERMLSEAPIDDPLFAAANIPKGMKMEGQFYPLVYKVH